jgi:dCMP deaminase
MKNRYIKPMMEIAKITASLSYAQKKKVGAIILKDGRIIASGYNGTVKDTDNCCEEIVNIEKYVYRCDNKECESNTDNSRVYQYYNEDNSGDTCVYCYGNIAEYSEKVGEKLVTSKYVLHAEENAILQCAENGIVVKDSIMICTHSPCEKCARMIAQVGIKAVYFEEIHDNGEGADWLQKHGKVKVFHIKKEAL